MEKSKTATKENSGTLLSEGLAHLKEMLKSDQDVVDVILEDHKPLKELIKVMKDSDKTLEERKQAFSEFAPLLVTHAKAEEESLYGAMKMKGSLREDAFEGDAEHSIADQLVEEIKRTTEKDKLSARIKVLAELVEHHIEEEENEQLPHVRKELDPDVLKELTKVYIDVQEEMIAQGQDDAPHESELRDEDLRH